METRPFGSTGREVSVIGQGTWNMERDDRRTVIAALRRGLDLGQAHIDTAEMYGSGVVEEIVGRVRDPDRKGKVESSIGHTQRTPLKGLRFESLDEAQTYLDCWERDRATMFREEVDERLANEVSHAGPRERVLRLS